MTIDILHYELKYKHDEDVLALLSEIKAAQQEARDAEDEAGEMSQAASDFDDLKGSFFDAKVEIVAVAEYLKLEHKPRNKEKAEDFISQIDDLLKALEGVWQ